MTDNDKQPTTRRSEADAGLSDWTVTKLEQPRPVSPTDWISFASHAAALAAKDADVEAWRKTSDGYAASLKMAYAELRAARELVAALQPLAEIGRLSVKRREAQIRKDNTPAGDIREVLLRRADLLDAGADLDDAINTYLRSKETI